MLKIDKDMCMFKPKKEMGSKGKEKLVL